MKRGIGKRVAGYLGEAFERAGRRFPLAVLAAVLMTAAWCLLVWLEFEDGSWFFIRILMAASLGLPWLLATGDSKRRVQEKLDRPRSLPDCLKENWAP